VGDAKSQDRHETPPRTVHLNAFSGQRRRLPERLNAMLSVLFGTVATTLVANSPNPRRRDREACGGACRVICPRPPCDESRSDGRAPLRVDRGDMRRPQIGPSTWQDVRQLVERVAEAGAPIVANRVAALLSKVFAFALDRDLVPASPAVRIPRPGQERARDRVLTEDELRALWQSFEALEPAMSAFYKLRLLTAQRGEEVAAMRWRDVDLDAGWWTVPAASSKNKLAHRVPLNGPALVILTALLAMAKRKEEEEEFVLVGARGKRQQAEAAATFKVKDFRGHDLRRTAASLMASAGVPRLTISKILNHVERGVTKVYDRHSYDPEKKAALNWWATSLLAILKDKDRGRILPFTAGAWSGEL
jgi:integrase